MSKQVIAAITGPTGSGKSTVAQILSKQIEKCVNIDADHVKHFIVNGFVYDKSPTGVKQWELLGDNIGLLAKNFQNADYNVIINGYINEPAWSKIQNHVTLTHKFLLLPHLDTVFQRDLARSEEVAMGDAAVKVHHDHFSNNSFFDNFTKLDSTNMTAQETAAKVKEILGKNWGEL